MITRVLQAIKTKKTQRRFSYSDIPEQKQFSGSIDSIDPTLPVEAFEADVAYEDINAEEKIDPITSRHYKVVYVKGTPAYIMKPEPLQSTRNNRDSVLVDDESFIEDDGISIDTSCSIVFSTASRSYQEDGTTNANKDDNDGDDKEGGNESYQDDGKQDGSRLETIKEIPDKKEDHSENHIINSDPSMHQPKHREHFYCPYYGCTRSAAQIRTVMKHIRKKHFPDCPPLSTSDKRLFRTPRGDVLHFNSESCRNTLKAGEEVIREFTDNAVRYYCPYEGCWAASKNLKYLHTHIKKKHYEEYPTGSPQYTRINSTRNGKTLDFSEKSRNTVQTGDKILVHHVIDQGNQSSLINMYNKIATIKGKYSRGDPKEAVSTTVVSSIASMSSPDYAVIKGNTKTSVKDLYTQTPLSIPVYHTTQEYARRRAYSC